jgi:hypothetical protein
VSLEEDHAQQILAPLIANGNILALYDGIVDPTISTTYPYVLAYIAVTWPRDGLGTSLKALQVTVTTTATIHCAALSPAGARAVAAQVRSSLLNYRPTITGRDCSPIKQDTAEPVARDESTSAAIFDAISVFSFSSTG